MNPNTLHPDLSHFHLRNVQLRHTKISRLSSSKIRITQSETQDSQSHLGQTISTENQPMHVEILDPVGMLNSIFSFSFFLSLISGDSVCFSSPLASLVICEQVVFRLSLLILGETHFNSSEIAHWRFGKCRYLRWLISTG